MTNKTKSEKASRPGKKQTKESSANMGVGNNNDDEYRGSYIIDGSTGDIPNGRVSRESAFSSDGAYDESSSGSASGRSSANQEPICKKSLIKPVRTVIPELDEVRDIVERLRTKFLQTYESSRDKFDEADWEELSKPVPPITEAEHSLGFRLLSRYFNFNSLLSKGVTDEDIDKACNQLVELLIFRRRYDVLNTTVDDFPKEFYQIKGLFQFGRDINNLPVVYMRARWHRRWAPKLDDLFRKYATWQFNTITKSFREAKIGQPLDTEGRVKDGSFGICFDCSGVSYACIDLDFMRFLVKILVEYYPTYCQYCLSIDLPWLFRSIWKLVRSWLPEEAQNSVHLITAKELPAFIPEDQIPNCIPYNDMRAEEKPAKNKHDYPANYSSLRTLEDMAKELNISPSEVKQAKAHLEKVCKEYKRMGAI